MTPVILSWDTVNPAKIRGGHPDIILTVMGRNPLPEVNQTSHVISVS